MANIVVVFPKLEDAKTIRNLLVRRGFPVQTVCASGAQALAAADQLGSGVIVCGYRLPDMLYDELYENAAPDFDLLLLASPRAMSGGIREGVVGVEMPLKAQDLLDSLEMLLRAGERRRKKKKKNLPPRRSSQEQKRIADAKALLMERNHMTEEEAHRYLQKTSMDSGTNLAETAEMIFALMKE